MASKEKYLRLKKKKTTFDKFKDKLPIFFSYLNAGELSMSPAIFYGLSIICCILFAFIYAVMLKRPIITFAGGLVGLCFPYIVYAPSALTKMTVNEALSYKEFISILQSSIRATNSTHEAIKMCANENELPNSIKLPVQSIITNMQLGDSLNEALLKAENMSENPYFKMTLTILRINHDVGTSKTINALENIQKSQDAVINNLQLLKDKINSVLMEKTIFIALALASPIMHVTSFRDIVSTFYDIPLCQLLVFGLLVFALIGQFIITESSIKALKEL